MENAEVAMVAQPVSMNKAVEFREIDSWEWERYFQSAKGILEERVESKGDITYTYKLNVTPTMVSLSQSICEQLLMNLNNRLSKLQ